VQDVDTDNNGQFTVELGELDDVVAASASATGGYVANVSDVTGNEVSFALYQGGGADSELSLVTGGADVTDVYIETRGS